MTKKKANKVVDAVLDSTQEFVKVDTTVIQVRSVLNFMYALGYTLDEDGKTGRFTTNQKVFKANRHLSFATAVRLHNMPLEDWTIAEGAEFAHPKGVNILKGFAPLGVHLATASKLVSEVKLSVSRYGQVLTQDVMVHPLNKTVIALIGA